MAKKPKLLFVYSIDDEQIWKDGLWAAIEFLKKDFEIKKINIQTEEPSFHIGGNDFILGWGAFGSPVDKWIQSIITEENIKTGLCLGGYAPYQGQKYDILFYEVENWSKEWLKQQGYQGKTAHAFGVNTDIFKPIPSSPKLFNYLTVGAFATWKRQELICTKFGTKMAIGQIQKDNMGESINIIGNLLLEHCGVMDSVIPEELVKFYNCAKTVYLPADTNGGSERALLEARACGIPIEIEKNPKLQELLTSPVWSHKDYAEKLKEGILSCL